MSSLHRVQPQQRAIPPRVLSVPGLRSLYPDKGNEGFTGPLKRGAKTEQLVGMQRGSWGVALAVSGRLTAGSLS